MCVEKTCFGSFWEEFLVFVSVKERLGGLQSLRVMKKRKIIEYGEEDMVYHEYYVRSRIRHPFLVNIICGFQDHEHLFLLSEQSPNHLMYLINCERRLSIKVARFYIAEILLAIQHLHSKGLRYEFLSPSTVMIGDDGHIKLKYDFLNGIDTVVGDVDHNIEYASMDGFFGKRHFASDYWSLGVVLYQMIVGITPFASPSVSLTMSRIQECSVIFPPSFDVNARDLVSRLLVTSVRTRLGYKEGDAEVIRAHPFFDDFDWDKLVLKEIEPPFLFNTAREEARSANLSILYTTDYLPEQKDGYGQTFRNYGSTFSPDAYSRMWKHGYI